MTPREHASWSRAFALVVRARRDEIGMNASTLANCSGVGRHVYEYESGRVLPQLPTIAAIAETLRLSLTELVSRVEARRVAAPVLRKVS